MSTKNQYQNYIHTNIIKSHAFSQKEITYHIYMNEVDNQVRIIKDIKGKKEVLTLNDIHSLITKITQTMSQNSQANSEFLDEKEQLERIILVCEQQLGLRETDIDIAEYNNNL